MKSKINKVSVILLLSALLLNGCGLSSSSDQNLNETKNGETSVLLEETVEDSTEDENSKQEEEHSTDSTDQVEPPITKEVHVYTISSDATETRATIASVPEDTTITAGLVAQLVISDIADKSYVITVKEVTVEDDHIIVDFDSATPPVKGVGEHAETAILDAFAFSMIDNLPECNGVIFRADGKAYVSDNYSYGIDEIYLSR